MNHKPFEDLILSSDGMTTAERTTLQEHLKSCESCRSLSHAWEHVVMEIRTAPTAEPASGFSTRWQQRLIADSVRRQRRQSLLILTFCVLGAGLLMGVLGLLALPLVDSPMTFLMTWISRGWMLLSTADVLQNMLTTLIKALSSSISPLWLVLILGLGSLLAVLWAASLRMLMSPGRVMK